MPQPLVSVIVPAYNAAGFISRCVERITSQRYPELELLLLNDGSTAAIMALGGKGVISVAANVVPREMHELTQLCLENRFLEAGTLQLKLHELIRALFCEVTPIPVKAAMELLGLCSGELRLPLCRISERHLDQLSRALKPFRASV